MYCGGTRPISASPRLQPPTRGGIVFTYLGRTTLTVTGPATGTVYRFATSGARLRIHPRDVAALKKVGPLRAVG